MGRLDPTTYVGVFLLGFVAGATDLKSLEGCQEEPVVMEDVELGWEDNCLGLKKRPEIGMSEACKEECMLDVTCSVWQFAGEGEAHGPHCYLGTPSHACRTRVGFSANAGQRLQHGKVKVLGDALGVEVMGLKAYIFDTGTEVVDEDRCKRACYSDVTCGVWQYGEAVGSKGCWIEHGPDHLRGKLVNGSAFANDVEAGEFIEHYCPPPPKEEPTLTEQLLGGGKLAIGLFVGLIICIACCIRFLLAKTKPKKTTRAVKTFTNEEDNHPQWKPPMVVEYIPQVPPIPVAYTLVAQDAPVFAPPQPTVLAPAQPTVVLPGPQPSSFVVESAPLLVDQSRLV